MTSTEKLFDRAKRYLRSDAGRTSALAIAPLAAVAIVNVQTAYADPGGSGACCLPAQICIVVATETICLGQGGVFQGPNTNCGPDTCLGACCFEDGTCGQNDNEQSCEGSGGVWNPGVGFADVVCPIQAHPGWNWVDNAITLTANEPTYWSAATGQPKGVSPFWVLDPGRPGFPGRLDPDAPGTRIVRGYIVGWAVDQFGNEIRWNHLKGEGTIVSYFTQHAWEYNSWNHAVVANVPHGEPLAEPGVLRLDGAEYSLSFDELLLNFQAAGSAAFGIPSDTDLTLHPPSADLRQNSDGPVTTKASFDIWNENETKFSGTHRCITCWDQTLLSNYDTPNHFLFPFLQTNHGKARIDGHAADVCNVLDDPMTPEDESVTSIFSPLLGVYARLFGGDAPFQVVSASGSNLVGLGTDDTAVIRYDVSGGGGPPESQEPGAPADVAGLLARLARDDAAGPGNRVAADDNDPLELGGGQDRVSATEKGSLFFLTKVELRYGVTGNLIQDTFISLTNDYPKDVRVQMYFINGLPPIEAGP